MRERSCTAARLLLSGFMVVLLAGAGCPASELPTPMPGLPALIEGSNDPQSFAVDGVCRLSASGGFGFHFATDGARQSCIIFDPRDGTPIYLSDGGQTLVYDLLNNRVVRVPASRAFVNVDWIADSDKPLRFNCNVVFNNDPKKLAEAISSFRIDRFARAAANSLRLIAAEDDCQLIGAERADGYIEALEFPRGKMQWFRFTSCKDGEDFYRMELRAEFGDSVPPGALAFPDLGALGRDVAVVDLDEQLMPNFLLFLRHGYASLVKMALAGGDDLQKSADKVLLRQNWNELRTRDHKLGEAYRAALSKQGIVCSAPVTRPSR